MCSMRHQARAGARRSKTAQVLLLLIVQASKELIFIMPRIILYTVDKLSVRLGT